MLLAVAFTIAGRGCFVAHQRLDWGVESDGRGHWLEQGELLRFDQRLRTALHIEFAIDVVNV